MKAKGWVEALTSRSRAEVAEVEGSVISEVLWKGFQEIPAELWHFPPQEACSFYAVCVFFVSLLKNTYLKKVTKGNQGKKLLSGLQLRKRKCVCQRLGVAAEEKRAAPNGQANSKAKQVSSVRLALLRWRVSPHGTILFLFLGKFCVFLFWGHNGLNALCGMS